MIKIKNWSDFQHFKDRTPPWIKLHKTVLEQRDISVISDCSFRVLVGLWLLASEDKSMQGILPPIEDIAFRLRKTEKEIDKSIQELSAFLEYDDNTVISERYQDDDPEKRRGETETDAYHFVDFYDSYPNKKAKDSAEKAYKKVVKSGVTHEEIMSGLRCFLADIEKNKTEKRFIAHPASWLNAGRYADEYEAAGPRIR